LAQKVAERLAVAATRVNAASLKNMQRHMRQLVRHRVRLLCPNEVCPHAIFAFSASKPAFGGARKHIVCGKYPFVGGLVFVRRPRNKQTPVVWPQAHFHRAPNPALNVTRNGGHVLALRFGL
jgi:hypothetical protein